MPRIRKATPKTHVVLVDTNALWHADKAHPVAPEFVRLWAENRAAIDMELVIPQVVYEELLFQQTTSASKSLERATKAFAEVSAVAARPFTPRLTVPQLKQHVRQKLDKWIASTGAVVRPVPCMSINWEGLVEKALWREPPFAYDPKQPDSEKGFRDALIMETVVNYCREETRDVIPVFICDDNLLRASTEKELRDVRPALFHDSMESFASYVRLTKEHLTQQFIKLILSRASERFFQKDDHTCLYAKGGVREQLRDQCAPYIADPQLAAPTTAGLLGNLPLPGVSGQESSKWLKDGTGMFWITPAKFARMEEPKIYHWISAVTYVALYKRQEPSTLAWLSPLLPAQDQERALILSFDVPWHARVTANDRFHDIMAEDVQLRDSLFAAPTQHQIEAYGLRSQGS